MMELSQRRPLPPKLAWLNRETQEEIQMLETILETLQDDLSAAYPPQSSTTLPDWPDFMAAKPFSNSV